MAEFPNYFSTAMLRATTSSTGATGQTFGFGATYLRLLNTEAVDVYARLNSTGEATTGDLRVRACSDLVLPSVPRISGLAIYSTTTGASQPTLWVTALSG